MTEKNDKWEFVEKSIEKDGDASTKEIAKTIGLGKESPDSPEGIIARFKTNQIEKKVGFKLLEKWYEGQLEVATHQIARAVEVKKKGTNIDAEHYLAELDKRHLQSLYELGLSNFEDCANLMDKAQEKTARMLEQIKTRDWPQSMIDETIKNIIELKKRLFAKIMQE